MIVDDHIITETLIMDIVVGQSIHVHHCHTINEAQAAWKKYGSKIDTIVLDLMMSSFGLEPIYREQTEDDYITGWIWLCSQKHFEDNKDIRIIIYSAYLSFLSEHIVRRETSENEKRLFERAVMLNKGLSTDVSRLKSIILNKGEL